MLRNPRQKIPHGHWNRARELRRESTVAEKKLWHWLRTYSVGTKFRRQEPLGPFIVDFYAPECALVIELDGEVHALPEAELRDREREHYLAFQDLRIVRYTNRDVIRALDGVLADVKRVVDEQLAKRQPDSLMR